jgi:NADH-quinone oxidoreductase subunit M
MASVNNMILTVITLLPLVGMLIVFAMRSDASIKRFALWWSLLPLALSIYLWFAYDQSAGGFQFEAIAPWIPPFNVFYHVGVDGFSVPMIFLTALLTTVSLWYSAHTIDTRVREYFGLFLLLETAMIGVFVSLDLFLFYVFFELSLVPMYFLIGIWGGPRREYASIKFFLYTLMGSVLMLLAIIAVAMDTGSFSMVRDGMSSTLVDAAAAPFATTPTSAAALLTFLGFFVALAIKVPLFPFHTWLPDAHVEAPTAGSIILAGVLLKLGTYGFVRILVPMFPDAFSYLAIPIAFLAFTSIVYGAFVAMAQWDFKKLIAYSSVNHMGYVILGITAAVAIAQVSDANAGADAVARAQDARAAGISAAVLQMFNHGIITGALFLLVGLIYDRRTHERDFRELGTGMWRTVPRYGAFLIVAAFASLGLPGLAGFVSEFFVFRGAFGVALMGNLPLLILTWLSVLGIVVTAAFILWKVIQMLLLGPQNTRWVGISDLNRSEMGMLAPLVLFMLLFGIYPAPILSMIDSATAQLLPLLEPFTLQPAEETASLLARLLGL